jgi:hypothetical protein
MRHCRRWSRLLFHAHHVPRLGGKAPAPLAIVFDNPPLTPSPTITSRDARHLCTTQCVRAWRTMRLPTSCRECRVGKRKCTPDPAGKQHRCLVCKSRRITCSNAAIPVASAFGGSTVRPELLTLPATSVHLSTSTPSGKEFEFINLYFRYIHDRPHSLFHEKSAWEALRNGTLPEHLWRAMCILGCRFAHQSQRDLASAFAEQSRALLDQQLDQLSIENVQTCILLGNWYTAAQNADLQIKYFGKSCIVMQPTSTDDQ